MIKLLILLTLFFCSQKEPKYKVGQAVVFYDEMRSYCINRGIIANHDEYGYTVITMQRSDSCPSTYKIAEKDVIVVIGNMLSHITMDTDKWTKEKK